MFLVKLCLPKQTNDKFFFFFKIFEILENTWLAYLAEKDPFFELGVGTTINDIFVFITASSKDPDLNLFLYFLNNYFN